MTKTECRPLFLLVVSDPVIQVIYKSKNVLIHASVLIIVNSLLNEIQVMGMHFVLG